MARSLNYGAPLAMLLYWIEETKEGEHEALGRSL